jgi:hypothetical protein
LNWKASLIAAVIVIAAGAAVGVAIGGKKETKVVTTTETVAAAAAGNQETATTPPPTTPSGASGGGPVGGSVDSLKDFENQSRLDFPGDSASVGSLNVSGKDYPEALSSTGYSDGSGFYEFKLITQAHYSSMTGTVGLSAGTDCPQNGALVSIRDESNRPLWGPKRVGITSPAKFSLDVPDAVQLRFINQVAKGNSNSGGNCSDAHSDPAWAGIELVPK